jgi:lantibiotic modifying enzyme
MKWDVFLPEQLIDRIEGKLHELAECVAVAKLTDCGLMGGLAGVAVFYAYYAQWTGNHRFKRLVGEMVERAINPPTGLSPGYSFSNGFAGIAWMVQHLVQYDLIEFDASAVLQQLEPRIGEKMITEISEGHYDYLHGAGGMALYFLAKNELNTRDRAYLSTFVSELNRHGAPEADGIIKWESVLDIDSGSKGYNLSLSHGMASIIFILVSILRKGVEENACRKMINGACKYIRKQRLQENKYISMYPSWAIESMINASDSRLAWCYGDTGIGIAFSQAGIVLEQSNLVNHGLEILEHSAMRRHPEENRVVDAGICHGAAGLALMNNIFYQHSHNKLFREAAAHWADVCLNMAFHSDGLGGYKAFYSAESGGWTKVAGLLEGAAGIGLTFLSFVSPIMPAWHKAFLIDL